MATCVHIWVQRSEHDKKLKQKQKHTVDVTSASFNETASEPNKPELKRQQFVFVLFNVVE